VLPSLEVQVALLARCPSWHACAEGPINEASGERWGARVDLVFQRDREDAEVVVWLRVAEQCAQAGLPFDRSEWRIKHLRVVNGN
jgi:hypothetical protein